MNEAIAALLARPKGKHAAVLAASSACNRFEAAGAQVVPDRELAKTLRERKKPALVVAITKLKPTLLRALRDAPPRSWRCAVRSTTTSSNSSRGSAVKSRR